MVTSGVNPELSYVSSKKQSASQKPSLQKPFPVVMELIIHKIPQTTLLDPCLETYIVLTHHCSQDDTGGKSSRSAYHSYCDPIVTLLCHGPIVTILLPTPVISQFKNQFAGFLEEYVGRIP